MKAILEFNLPDDQWSFDLAVKATDLARAMGEFYAEIRKMRKYESEKWHEETLEAVHKAWVDATSEIGWELLS